mgnify:CR=1 FL=1
MTIKNMEKLFLCILLFVYSISESKDPHDDDLRGKNLMCFNKSLNIDDWGLKFLQDKNVELFSLNKNIYEIYQYKRKYRTDIRNIYIYKNKDIDYIINRNRLLFGNKKCKIVTGDPIILFQQRIDKLKKQKQEGNRI